MKMNGKKETEGIELVQLYRKQQLTERTLQRKTEDETREMGD